MIVGRFPGLVVLDQVGKRIRLKRKLPAHLAGLDIQSRPRVWKRLRHVGHCGVSYADCKRRRYDQHDGDHVLVQNRIGVG